MKTTLLDIRPLPGDYPEKHFNARGQCTSVLFEDQNYQDWLGIFGNGGVTQYSAATLFSTTSAALIMAKGEGYAVDVNTKQLTYKTKCDYLVDALQIPDRDLIIAYNFTNIFAFTSKKQVWDSGRIASDGLKFEGIFASVVHGKVWAYTQWQNFTLNLNTFKLEFEEIVE